MGRGSYLRGHTVIRRLENGFRNRAGETSEIRNLVTLYLVHKRDWTAAANRASVSGS
jgi:hypothetical protein